MRRNERDLHSPWRRGWRPAAVGIALAGLLPLACEQAPPATTVLAPDAASPSRTTERGDELAGDTHDDRHGHRRYGAPVRLGNGWARSYVETRKGKPYEIGIALSARALDGLPAATGGVMSHEFLLPLPKHHRTQYQLVELNWNPMGHPPPMVYTVPHFDFHFYTIPLAERNAVDPSDPEYAAKAARLPATDLRTPGWVPPPGPPAANAVPRMGLHWINPASPEFHGGAFTRTFIIGSWDGKFTFLEPMVTRDYLLSRPHDVVPVATAARHAPAGYYPTAYRVEWNDDAHEWRIALTSLENVP